MIKRDYNGIAVITIPLSTGESSKARHGAFEHLTSVLKEYADHVIVITGNLDENIVQKQGVTVRNLTKPFANNRFPFRFMGHMIYQFRVSVQLIQLRKKVQVAYFHVGGTFLLLPIVTSRLLGLQTVICATGAVSKEYRLAHRKWKWNLLSMMMSVLEQISFALASRIMVFSEGLITFGGIRKYRKKISIADFNYVDTSVFKRTSPITERPNAIAFVGRIDKVKGVINFVRSIPLILDEGQDISFIIIGDGTEKTMLEDELALKKLDHQVIMTGWATPYQLVEYLNRVRLVVLPSVSEGLPKLIPEAMACGTPVLATPVGSIPDLIKDEETGFLMEDNTPECIAQNVLRALRYPRLESISQKGLSFVEQRYGYHRVVDEYRKALKGVSG